MLSNEQRAPILYTSPPSTAGIRRAEQLLQRVQANAAASLATGVLGPGGCGKSLLLSDVREAYEAAGFRAVDVDELADGPFPADAVVLVDDAHLLTSQVLQRVGALIRKPGARVIVAFRPWPRPPALMTVAAALRRNGPLTVLQHLTRDEVEQRATAILAEPIAPAMVDLITAQTGGQPLVLDEALASLQEGGRGLNEVTADPAPLLRDVVERLRFLLDDQDGTTHALLHAIAAGAKVETGVLSALLGVDQVVMRQALEEARAGGFLLAEGRLIPLIRMALLTSESVERTRELQTSLLDIHTSLGHDVVPVARALAGSGIRNQRAASVLVAAGDAQLHDEPAAGAVLYSDAVRAGEPPRNLAVRRAEAALFTGQLDRALQLADPVLVDDDPRDLAGAIDVVATVMAHRGQLGRAAELYGWLGPDRLGASAPMAALALLGTGEPAEAATIMTAAGRHSPTMLAGAKALLVDGLQTSLGDSYTAALAALNGAASMLESCGGMSLLLDSPAALAALVAIDLGEFDLAESGLRRAVDQSVGGPLARPRHLLLLAWTAILRGRFSDARALLAQAHSAGSALEPRDEIFATGVELGLARRTGDTAALARAWHSAREIIVRQPVDLFVLLPLGEFAVAAARLGETSLLNHHLTQAWYLLDRLGDQGIWSRPLAWACVQANMVCQSVDDVESLADALDRMTPANGYGVALAQAARAWSGILAGPVDAPLVQKAASALAEFGLEHEAAQLLSDAAARFADRRQAATMLHMVRAMRNGGEPASNSVNTTVSVRSSDAEDRESRADLAARPPAYRITPTRIAAAVLSGRELEVARLLLRNKTYREIGELLFISPKTVEHHVARMKQRVGVTRRSELFAELQELTADR